MINRKKSIMVFIIFITVLTFGTGVKNRNSQNETAPVNPVIIKSKNKSGKYEDAEENADKKKKHSLKNKKNIEKELKNNKGQSTETDEANLSNGNENPQNVDANNLNNAKNVKNGENEVTPNEKLDNKDQNKKKKKDKTDKEKKVIEAEDKEIEGISKYGGPVHKFIATREGKVLKAEGEKEKHPTASLAKVMNIIVALDEIDKGNASLDDEVCFTPDTAYLKGSWLNVRHGDCFTLETLLKAEIIYSANNAAYLVAKHIGKGNIENFVALMNEKAQELGMTDTVFYTPAGLPTSMTGKPMDISTAYDLYLMGRKASEDDRIKEWSSQLQLELSNPNGDQVIYKNRNALLYRYGIYGLKTGFHADAGYNLILTSRLGNLEIVSVTLGNRTDIERNDDQKVEFTRIEDRLQVIYTVGKEMGKFKVENGKKRELKGVISDNVYQIDNSNYTFRINDLNVDADQKGIEKGEKIAMLEVLDDGNIVSKIEIVAGEDTEPLSWFGKILRMISFGLV